MVRSLMWLLVEEPSRLRVARHAHLVEALGIETPQCFEPLQGGSPRRATDCPTSWGAEATYEPLQDLHMVLQPPRNKAERLLVVQSVRAPWYEERDLVRGTADLKLSKVFPLAWVGRLRLHLMVDGD